ncbi:MAG: hypothetical protein ACOYK8_01775 [Alphaproteobacteria bacterium]
MPQDTSNRFNDEYYAGVLLDHGYSEVDFSPMDFGLLGLDGEYLKRKFVCHHNGDVISDGLLKGEKTIITTGFGMSGNPHLGSISQIIKIVELSNAGIPTQLVLGDLDAMNARNQSLDSVRNYARGFEGFARSFGYNTDTGIIRDQYSHPEINRTAFMVSNYLTDRDFEEATEDCADAYKKAGIYEGWSFGMKQSLTLMIADFIHLHTEDGYKNVMVMLGLEEHKYVKLAKTVSERMGLEMNIAGIYGRIIRGLGGHHKMSKSLPGSSINVITPDDEVRSILLDEPRTPIPRDNAAFQIMEQVSDFNTQQLKRIEEVYRKGEDWEWRSVVGSYIENQLLPILNNWPERNNGNIMTAFNKSANVNQGYSLRPCQELIPPTKKMAVLKN